MSHSWNSLPFEIALCIFEHLPFEHDDMFENPYIAKDQLLPCLLVCKSWNKAAAITLYENVTLERQGLKFLNTLYSSSTRIGYYVKELHIGYKFVSNAFNYSPIQVFVDILHHCPHLEHIRLAYAVQRVLVPCLMTESRQLTRIKTLSDELVRDGMTWYFMTRTPLCFKESLSRLALKGIGRSVHTRNDETCLYHLIDQLGQFNALTQLCIVNCTVSLSLFDKAIDNCRRLNRIHICISRFSDEEFEERLIQPNDTIQSFTCELTHLKLTTYTYFAMKFRGLQTLKITDLFLFLKNDETWMPFVNLFRRLNSYQLRVRPADFRNLIPVYAKQLALSNRCSPQNRSFVIEFNTKLSVYLEITYKDEVDKILLDRLNPNLILETIDLIIDVLARYPTMNTYFQGFNNMIDFAFSLDSSDNLQKVIKSDSPNYSSLDWDIFDRVRLQNVSRDNTNLTISHLVLRYEHSDSMTSTITSSSYPGNLIIQYSIIHKDLFPEISSRYPNLNALTLSSCAIIGCKDPFRMTIDLPHMRLNRLVIRVSKFFTRDWLASYDKPIPDEAEPLYNSNLRNALLNNDRLIVAVEQKTMPTCWFIKSTRSDRLCPSSQSACERFIRAKRNGCFLLTIKCYYLKSLLLKNEEHIGPTLYTKVENS